MGEGAEISTNGDNDVEVFRGILALLSANELDVVDCLVQSSSPLSILRCKVLALAFDDDDFLGGTIANAADGEVGFFGHAQFFEGTRLLLNPIQLVPGEVQG